MFFFLERGSLAKGSSYLGSLVYIFFKTPGEIYKPTIQNVSKERKALINQMTEYDEVQSILISRVEQKSPQGISSKPRKQL